VFVLHVTNVDTVAHRSVNCAAARESKSSELNAVTEDVAGRFANLRSAWRHFLVNCGILADRFLAYTLPKSHF